MRSKIYSSLNINTNTYNFVVVPVSVTDIGDGKYRVSFRPKPNQKYAVGVALVDPEKNAVGIHCLKHKQLNILLKKM